MRYASSVTDLIGNTPLVRLNRVTHGIAAPVLGADDRPIAAVNLSIARPVKTAELKRLVPQLLETTADIGKRAQQMDRFA